MYTPAGIRHTLLNGQLRPLAVASFSSCIRNDIIFNLLKIFPLFGNKL